VSRTAGIVIEYEGKEGKLKQCVILCLLAPNNFVYLLQHVASAGPCGARIEASLQNLQQGAVRLCDQCARPPPEVTPAHPELRLHTQQVGKERNILCSEPNEGRHVVGVVSEWRSMSHMLVMLSPLSEQLEPKN